MTSKHVLYALINAGLISLLFLICYLFPLPMLGIYPQSLEGLLGILTAPFIHASIEHLMNNLFPLFITMFILFLHFYPVSWQVLLAAYIFPGLFTWFFGREAYHIGASGMVYALTSYIFFTGFLVTNFALVALSFLVIFLHTGFIWGLLPLHHEVSWETHLGGFITGLILSVLLVRKIKQLYPDEPVIDDEDITVHDEKDDLHDDNNQQESDQRQ